MIELNETKKGEKIYKCDECGKIFMVRQDRDINHVCDEYMKTIYSSAKVLKNAINAHGILSVQELSLALQAYILAMSEIEKANRIMAIQDKPLDSKE